MERDDIKYFLYFLCGYIQENWDRCMEDIYDFLVEEEFDIYDYIMEHRERWYTFVSMRNNLIDIVIGNIKFDSIRDLFKFVNETNNDGHERIIDAIYTFLIWMKMNNIDVPIQIPPIPFHLVRHELIPVSFVDESTFTTFIESVYADINYPYYDKIGFYHFVTTRFCTIKLGLLSFAMYSDVDCSKYINIVDAYIDLAEHD